MEVEDEVDEEDVEDVDEDDGDAADMGGGAIAIELEEELEEEEEALFRDLFLDTTTAVWLSSSSLFSSSSEAKLTT